MPVSTLSSLALLSALNFTVLPTETSLFTSQSHYNGASVFLPVNPSRVSNMTAADLVELSYNNIVLVPTSCNVAPATFTRWEKSTYRTARATLAANPVATASTNTQTWYDLFFLLPVVYLYGFMLYRRRRQHYKDSSP